MQRLIDSLNKLKLSSWFEWLYIKQGRKVYEIRPGVDWDKTDALLLLRGKVEGIFFYLGDDLTDRESLSRYWLHQEQLEHF